MGESPHQASRCSLNLSGPAISKLGEVGGVGATIFASVLTDGTENLRSAINSRTAHTGVEASLDGSNHLVLTAVDGRNIEFTIAVN